MQIETDSEKIELNISNPYKYFTNRTNLIRYIDPEFDEDYHPSEQLHGFYFLPSNKTNEFIMTLNKNAYNPYFENYYTPEMRQNCNQYVFNNLETDTIIKYNDRHNYAVSFFGVEPEDATLEELIKGAYQIRTLIAMQNFKIAIGNITDDYGLLEKGFKERTNDPQSHHYSYWKFNEKFHNISCFDIAKNFHLLPKKN